MSRLALIPFHTTPSAMQLDGPARDHADEQLDLAIEEACGSIVIILGLGKLLIKAHREEFPNVIAKVREIMPKANTRLHRSYAWLMMATLKVSMHYYSGMNS